MDKEQMVAKMEALTMQLAQLVKEIDGDIMTSVYIYSEGGISLGCTAYEGPKPIANLINRYYSATYDRWEVGDENESPEIG